MGTDIHLYVEECKDGVWRQVLAPYICRYAPDRRVWSPWHQYGFDHNYPDPTNRQYTLFALLADVRNGSGFAGVRTHQPIVPLFPERGIPEDTSYEEDPSEDGFWLGDHSFTYAYLDELLEAPWDITFDSQGVVNQLEYEVWKEKGIPNSWAGGVYGGNAQNWTNEELEDLIKKGKATSSDYTTVHWSWQPLLNCDFHRWLLEILVPRVGDPKYVRVLMGFDS
jgi:hypothetical protein